MNAANSAGNYGYTTWTFWPPKWDVYIYEEIEKAWAGEMTVEAYLQGPQTLFVQEKTAGASEVLSVLVYKIAFQRFEAGYAAAIGLTMSALVGIVISIFIVLRKRGWEI